MNVAEPIDLPREPTGRHRHLSVLDTDDAAAVRAFQPAAVAVIAWTRICALVLGAVVAIVVATALSIGWLDGRIADRVKPIEYRLGRMEETLDRIADRQRAQSVAQGAP